jgi:hypothetical protein
VGFEMSKKQRLSVKELAPDARRMAGLFCFGLIGWATLRDADTRSRAMAELALDVLMALVAGVFLAYPFVHLRGIVSGEAQYSWPRVLFFGVWMFVSSIVIMEIAAMFALSVY